jgi:hypothetical protein
MTLHADGSWISTESTEALEPKGRLMILLSASGRAATDWSILVPTERCYDNDTVRELVDRALDPAEKLEPVERLKLWYQAVELTHPESVERRSEVYIHPKLRGQAPFPKLSADAPPLQPLTEGEARARFEKRGRAQWIVPDPVDKDRLWCMRPDGRLDAMSLNRYWTDSYAGIPDALEGDVAVSKPVFDGSRIWLGTARGLFVFDRATERVLAVPVGGVFFRDEIRQVSVQDRRIAIAARSGAWTYEPETGRWSR